MRNLQLLSIAVVVGSLAGLSLATGTMCVEYTNVTPGEVVSLYANTSQGNVSYGGVYDGVYNLANNPAMATGDGVTISNEMGTEIPAFCMDISQEAPTSFATYQIQRSKTVLSAAQTPRWA